MINTSPPTTEHDWPITPLESLRGQAHALPHLAIWRIALDASLALEELLLDASHPLSSEEVVRARRYVRDRDGSLWAQSRCATRRILGAHANLPPSDLRFELSPRGKPALDARHRLEHRLDFNLSHSGTFGLLGVYISHDDGPIQLGVDTERISTRRDLHAIARRVFSAREREALRRAGGEREQVTCFHAIWTQKEAYIKAVGEGMHLPLESFDVSPDLRRAKVLEARHEGAIDPGSWSMLGGWLGDLDYPFAVCLDRPLARVTQSLHTCPAVNTK